MHTFGILLCLLAQPARQDEAREGEAPAEPRPAATALEYLRGQYREDAEKYAFYADEERKQSLKLVEKPVMRWATDDDWSGDVFVWMHDGQPGVIGCILSGPSGPANRIVYDEFHVLGERPIAPARLHTGRNWEPEGGLARTALAGAPPPADSRPGRLVQMRQIARNFTAHMEADGKWELRLLPQPLFRYGDEKAARSGVIDGALFTWVWTKGTDPELVLLVEARQTESGPAWHYAPVRFSNRSLWLTHGDKEVWRAASHNEPKGGLTTLIYTTAFARTFAREASAKER